MELAAFNPEGLTRYATPERHTAADRLGLAPEPIPGLSIDPRTVRRVHARRMSRLAREANAAEQIARLPEPGEDVILIMAGSWHGWDMVEAVLKLAGQGVTIQELRVATLGFNNAQTDHLAEMLDDGRIGSCTFIVSEMFSGKNATEYDHLADVLESRGQRIATGRKHCKLLLIHLSDGRHIVAHGSLNLRRCNSFEQMAITDDADLYRFFSDYIDDVLTGSIAP